MANKKGKNKGYTYRYNKSGTVTCRKWVIMPDGSKTQLPATGKTETEARNKLDKKYADICKEGKQIKDKGYTVKTWCKYWLFEVKIALKGNTRDCYYSAFTNYIFPVIGNIRLQNLTLLDIQKVVTKVSNKTVIKNGVKQKVTGKTVKETIAPLLQALNFAMDDHLMPCINFRRLSKPKVKKGTRQPRPKEEQQIVTDYFCNKIPEQPFNLYYAPIAIMDARGIRPEECGGLQWQDIDYENNVFWVGRHTVVKNGIYNENNVKIGEHIVVENSDKTENGERQLPLGNFLANLFKMKYKEYNDKGITPKPTDFIFITKAGNPYYDQSLRKMYKSLAKKLGISEIGCYSLRHEFATFLAQVEKADKETVKQLMGWSELVDTYFHTDNDNKQKAVANIDNQFADSPFVTSEIESEVTENINSEVLSQKDNIVYVNFKNVVNQ